MSLTFPEELLESAHMTEAELQAELAVALFQRDRLTLGQAARLANLPYLDFQRLLASRRIPLHYGIEAMEEDLRRVNSLPHTV